MLVFGVYRLVAALPVLRWPLAGGLFAIACDLADLFLLYFIGGSWDSQALDKWFDLFFMATFLAVALRWPQPEKGVALALFAFRMVGFTAFEIAHSRPVLMLFPNVFEFWFMAVAAVHHWQPGWRFTRVRIAVLVTVVTGAKLAQEYMLHVGRWFDDVTIMDFVRDVWRTITPS